MFSNRNYFIFSHLKYFSKKYGTKSKIKVILNENVENSIEKNEFNPKHHPGIIKPKTISVPENIIKSIENVLKDRPVKALVADSKKLQNHLHGRVPPMEDNDRRETFEKVRDSVLNRFKSVVIKSEEEESRLRQLIQNKINNILRLKIYNWKPIKYDTYSSLLYLVGRASAEYAVILKILSEINARDPNFCPRSVFDFGSGVGTTTWACDHFWKGKIFEYFNVDCSSDMNDLSQAILRGGHTTGTELIKGVFYRQFLPAKNVAYDLVFSAYSLMELPSLETRLETVLNLWNKTAKYLVIVEQGTNAGFRIVNEVRDFILHLKNKSAGHVFSPCPHDAICPRFVLNDGTPCNFEVNYYTLPLGRSEFKQERYSYVVLKKGNRSSDDLQWPRIVRPTLIRRKHTICRMCTKDGHLQEVIFTASKHGKTTYHCARATKWGDLLPVSTLPTEITKENESETDVL